MNNKIINSLILFSLILLFISPALAGNGNAGKVRCPKVIAHKASGEYFKKRDAKCYKRTRFAENAGYERWGTNPTPTPTVAPTATATPVGNDDYTGTWTGTLSVTVDTCDTELGTTPVGDYDISRVVVHDGDSVTGKDTNANDARSWGTATIASDSFTLKDVFATEDCSNGSASLTEAFTSIDGDDATATRTIDVTCPVVSKTCQWKWSGDVSK